ncbi:family 43 glycosylhydrolase [Cellulosimicrobium protaetiae]|uniref:Family 43 glycosylhydrolase n=1 Tax=Cellulosimicrobium protaetiae TaxID=2587808 RepID=A0A6M5UNF9_9MICO|nr:family 43 glycosylhydrolase [Cellulosimicrobium protaetiae]QJW38728.1 family 43 glycosylhydrolase [Cellulosimicrobium protaetiae]
MTQRWMRALAGAMVVPLALSLAPAAATAATSEAPTNGLLAAYDFADGSGTALTDVSGNGVDGSLVAGGRWRAGTLAFDGGNYVRLPDGVLQGRTAATVTVMAKPDATALGRNNFLWSFGGSGDAATGQFFLGTNSHRAAISPTNWRGEQQVAWGAYQAGVWRQTTVTIEPDDNGTSTLTAYLDGVQVAQKTGSTVSLDDLTTHTNNLIGRSSYNGDAAFTGEISNVRVYDRALSADEVAQAAAADATEAADEAAFTAALDALTLGDTGNVTADLELPSEISGAQVTWTSSNPAVITDDGKVTPSTDDATVTLTATVTLGGYSAQKRFTVMVPAPIETAEQAAARLVLPYVLTAGTTLPTEVAGADVTWASDDESLVTAAGEVVGAAEGLADVELTATVTLGAASATKVFRQKVSEADPAFVAGYTRKALGGHEAMLDLSMHLALSTDGTPFRALNLNQGVLWPEADFEAEPRSGVTKQLSDPYVFRMKDGSFGVIATQTNRDGAHDETATGKALLFTSDDLVQFEQADELLDLRTDEQVVEPAVDFDGSAGEYRITWRTPDGATFVNTTADFSEISTPRASSVTSASDAPDANIDDAVLRSEAVLTRSEADVLSRRFTPVTNTAIDAPADLELAVGDDLPSTDDLARAAQAQATYSDGSGGDIAVDWDAADLAAVDTTTPGTYEVSGTVRTVDQLPLRSEAKADPQVFMWEGKYYFLATTEDDHQRSLYLYESETLEGLATAERHIIYDDWDNLAWAPEVHELDGSLYLNWARGSTWDRVTSTVAKLDEGGDILDPDDWGFDEAQPVVREDGTALKSDGITLDMTYFEANGQWYAMWSQRTTRPYIDSADLWIATIDPAQPWRLTSDAVTIARPTYAWERSTEVVEGPFALHHDGKLVITFSGAGTDRTYMVGQLEVDEDADLLDPTSWTKLNAPLLTSASVPGQFGPGHNAYFTDTDGTLITSIHARVNGGPRVSGVRAVRWGEFGNLLLDLTADRQALPENRDVTLTITVTGLAEPILSAAATTRCVAGRNVLVATLTNHGTAPQTVTVTTPHGVRSAIAIGAGKSVSTSFATRLTDLPAGTVTAQAHGSGDEATAHYPAGSCR